MPKTRMNHCHRVDVERLHAVMAGELHGRGVGASYAKVHELAMQAAGGDFPSIVYEVNFLHYYKDYLLDIVRDVFPVYNLTIDWDRSKLQHLRVLREDGTEITVFVTVRGMNTRGLIRGPYVEVAHDCEIPDWRK